MHPSKSKIVSLLFFVLAACVGPFCAVGQAPPEDDIAAARRLMADGDSLTGKGDDKSLVDAEQKYRLALELFRKQNAQDGEAWSLFSLGRTYKQLRKYDDSIKHFELSAEILRKGNDPLKTAKAESNIAAILETLGRPTDAKARYLAALEMCSRAGEFEFAGFILNDLGKLEVQQGGLEQAVDYLERAKKAFEQVKYTHGAYMSSLSVADVHVKLKKFGAARAALTEALTIVRTLNSRPDEWLVQKKICEVERSAGNAKEAIACFQENLQSTRKLQDAKAELSFLQGLAHAFTEAKDYKNASESLNTTIQVAKTLGNRGAEAFAYFDLGFVFQALEKHAGAVTAFDNARHAFRETNLREMEAYALGSQGWAYNNLGKTGKAIECFEQALSISRELGKSEQELAALTSLGSIFDLNYDYPRSLQYFEKALDLARKLKKKDRQGPLLIDIGIALFGTKQYDKILAKYVEALAIAREIGDKATEVRALERLGAFYLAVGQFSEARQNYESSLKIAVEIQDESARNDALLGIADVQYKTGRFAEAQENYQKILAASKGLKSAYLEASALIGLGVSLRSRSQPEKALSHLKRAFEVAANGDERYRAAQADNELGNTYIDLKEFDKALTHAQRALTVSGILSDEERVALSLGTVMKAHEKLNHPELAVFYGKVLINLIQAARSKLNVYGEGVRKSFLTDKGSFYREVGEILISQGRIVEAERILAMLKEEEYFEYIRRDGDIADELSAKISLTPEEQKAFDEYKKYADQLTALGKELGELQTESRQYEIDKFPKQARINELEKQIANANVVFTAFLDSLKLSIGTNDVRVSTLESGSQALLKELREPRTVFISTIIGEAKLNIVVTTPDTQKAYSVKTKGVDINKLVADFRSALRSPRIDPRPAGKALFDVLFPTGVIRDLQGVNADTIVWSLDGTLRYVPISALWDGEKYLVERFNNVVITLASRDKIASKTGDRSKWSALGVGVSKETAVKESDGTTRTFEALPAVPEELCSVISDPAVKARCAALSSEAKGVMNGRTMLDDEFTLPSFKSSLGRFPVVHIASHFSLNAGNESDSYLLLGGGEDRRLSLAAIRQSGTQFVGVDLLTLSACNTGVGAGSKANGVEIEGFGALAQRSGARSVLASLWAVSDTSTRNLMIEFYRQLEVDPSLRKVDALRRAQISLLNGNYKPGERPTAKDVADATDAAPSKFFAKDPIAPFAHPYYWSPFILIGNWQ